MPAWWREEGTLKKHVYIYIYIHMCVCMYKTYIIIYIYIYTYTCIYIYIYTHTYIHTYIYTHIHSCVCACVYIYIHMHICTYVSRHPEETLDIHALQPADRESVRGDQEVRARQQTPPPREEMMLRVEYESAKSSLAS